MEHFIDKLHTLLSENKVRYSDGITEQELSRVENLYGFCFPEDLRSLLREITILDGRFINWQKAPNKQIEKALHWPYEGFCFDIEESDLWDNRWGERPDSLQERLKLFTDYFNTQAPTLIPIAGHRYIPSSPLKEGSPIFSVYQSDVICYGANLEEYILNEYGNAKRVSVGENRTSIPFWSDWIE